MPYKLITDSGGEFQGKVSDYMKKEKVNTRMAQTGRHRQVAMVERKNQLLGKVLFMKMHARELLTGKLIRDWTRDLPDIIERINDKYAHEPLTDKDLDEKHGDPWEEKQVILPIGTKVRLQLNEPRDIIGKRLYGDFRGMDTRWTSESYKIKSYLFEPHEPILYLIDKKYRKGERHTYTRNQLQVVSKDEQEPPGKMLLDDDNETFMVKKILNKRVRGRKNEYLIWWKGYPKDEATWTEESLLPKTMVREFNAL